MIKTYLPILFCLITVAVFADDDCMLYQQSINAIEQCKKELEKNKDEAEKNKLQKKVRDESEKAANYLENCSKSNPSSKPKENLLRWYKMAKLYVDAQKYDKAKPLLKACKDHPDAHSVIIEGKPLDLLANEILLKIEFFVNMEQITKYSGSQLKINKGEYTGMLKEK